MERRSNAIGPIVSCGILIGIGMGAFADGILLHQILQWHNMLSSRVPPVDLVSAKVNMLWDGIFHAAAWIVTAMGIARLWQAGHRRDVSWSGRAFGGSLAIGWALFNIVEGAIDHHILGVHHVHPGSNELAWDLGFLCVSAAMLVAGVLLVRGDTVRARHTTQA
jgi:uncharacterized membrane protein